jgi:DNA-binding response OmpR family regulator
LAQRILVVEDEPAIAESVAYALRRDGFFAEIAGSVEEAGQKLPDSDLVVLDLMLPDGSGFDLIGDLRREGRTIPVIDDYVTKPFSPREVVARVRAVLRRAARPVSGARAEDFGISVDAATRRAHVSGKHLELTRVEFDLLASLLESPGRVYTRAQIIDKVWGDGFAITDRTIDSHVKSLRKKVSEAGGDPGLIETVRGVGYRIAEQPRVQVEP